MSANTRHQSIYLNIQCARALAALAVVAYHLRVLPSGQAGVDVFFVISGFIMACVAPYEGRDFLVKRLIRIVPLYWVTTLGIYAIALLRPHWLNTTTAAPDYLVKSLLFIPYVKENGHWGPLNLNGWTLEYEMLFYLVVAAALGCGRSRHAPAFAALTLALLCACVAAVDPSGATVPGHLGQPFVLEFGLGVAAHGVLQAGVAKRVGAPVWAAVVVAAIAAIPLLQMRYGTPEGFARVVLWGGPAFMLIVALVALDKWNWTSRSRIMAALGASSYSIYLIHPYVIGMAGKLAGLRADPRTGAGLGAAWAILGAACVCGYVCHVWIERPMLKALNRRFVRARGVAESST
ncbi:acyltransferase family protein [Burkholderia ambifaria]|uniref:Acyltransferase 3 n=1 Tax=Burkholderia ambifaria IOP40-10 TaxID=396596 RepID=B1F807_9BURK|nr:acyltransferase [Burkholderia ambifaria]EDT06414.1 acyltransferase 3 [Burkholderia ambifaria IOP40-10]